MDSAPPQQWTRETPWRQGLVFKAETAAALGLVHPTEGATTCVVVVSHDCDLANDSLSAEPDVEFIVGRVVDAAKGDFQWGKSPRTLHLNFQRVGQDVIVELVAPSKCLVRKETLATHAPDKDFSLDAKALNVFRAWLSVRYNRAAFPEVFATRMNRTKLDRGLAKAVEPFGAAVSAVFFVVDDGKDLSRTDGSPNELSVFLAYVPGDDPDDAHTLAESAAQAVEKLFSGKCYDAKTEQWSGIWLKHCSVISEDDLRVSKARLLTQWRLEHLSYRADDEQPGPLAT